MVMKGSTLIAGIKNIIFSAAVVRLIKKTKTIQATLSVVNFSPQIEIHQGSFHGFIL